MVSTHFATSQVEVAEAASMYLCLILTLIAFVAQWVVFAKVNRMKEVRAQLLAQVRLFEMIRASVVRVSPALLPMYHDAKKLILQTLHDPHYDLTCLMKLQASFPLLYPTSAVHGYEKMMK